MKKTKPKYLYDKALIKFSKNFEQLKIQHSYTMEELAEYSGMSISSLYAIKNRRNLPGLVAAANLAEAFGVEIKELIS